MTSRRWKQIKTGLICSVFAFLFVFFVMNEMESRRLRHMPFITANALNYSYHPVRLPLKPASTVMGEHTRSISLNETDANALAGLYYSKEKKSLLLEVVFISDVLPFRWKKFCHYEISDPNVKKELFEYIETHEDELFDPQFRGKIRDMIARHKKELNDAGNGSMYLGIHKAGIIPTIRAGKDPEAEWRKKFSAR